MGENELGDDARPLTKQEKDLLVSCLFELSSAVYLLSSMHSNAAIALGAQAGIKTFDKNSSDQFLARMGIVIDKIEKLGTSFGVMEDGANNKTS